MSQHDIIGLIYTDTGEQDSEGNAILAPLDGFHVNTLEAIDGADDYIVTPNPHSRVFSGVPIEQHLFYRFVDEAQYREFVPAVEVDV
jgi:hypothetical protein